MDPKKNRKRKVEFRQSKISQMDDERASSISTSITGGSASEYNEEENCDQTPDAQMKRGLFAVSRQPARLKDIKSFQNLHSPRIHGMAEWILQYESVCRRQDQYLQQIKELRQQFRNNSGETSKKSPLKHHDNFQHSQGPKNVIWKPSRYPLFKTDDKFSNKACTLHPQRKHRLNNSHRDYWQPREFSKQGFATDFLMAPKSLRCGADLSTKHARQPVKLPPIGELDRNKTDYEPIEYIAKRNKLNLSKYLKEGQSWSRIKPRETMNLSDVYVQSTKIL